jgi:transcriptional regulator GlxA family with amidase domain
MPPERCSQPPIAAVEIARRAGFCHAQYLSCIFKRECGKRPAITGRAR